MNIEHLLVDRCELQRNKPVAGAPGAFVNMPVAYATDVPCRISPASGSDIEAASQRKASVSYAAYFLPGKDPRVEDWVVCNGKTYRVRVELPPSLPYHRKVLMEELQQAPAAIAVTGTADVL
jgi:hypothetical protein